MHPFLTPKNSIAYFAAKNVKKTGIYRPFLLFLTFSSLFGVPKNHTFPEKRQKPDFSDLFNPLFPLLNRSLDNFVKNLMRKPTINEFVVWRLIARSRFQLQFISLLVFFSIFFNVFWLKLF